MNRPQRNSRSITIAAALAAMCGVSLYAASTAAAGEAPAPEQVPDSPAQATAEPVQRPDGEQSGDAERSIRIGNKSFVVQDGLEFGESANDLFVWAWLPTIAGEVADNGFFGGQRVMISADADIGGDVFLFAQTAVIEGRVGGDVYAFVADLRIAEGARIEGEIHGSSGALSIDGEVRGPVSYAGGAVVLNGTLGGDVRLEVGELEIGPDAVVEGSLTYECAREATIDPGAIITGDIRHLVPRETDEDEEETSSAAGGWFSIWSLAWDGLWLLSSFLVGALALAVGGESARAPAARLSGQPALGLGFGFVVAVVFPAAAILAMILIVTIPLGLIALALYMAAAYLGRLVAAQAVGAWVLNAVRRGQEASVYASLAVGLVILFFLMKIPYLGFLIWVAAIVAGLGGIFLATRGGKSDDAAAVASPLTP